MYLKKTRWVHLVNQCVHKYRAVHWNMGSLWQARTWKQKQKTYCPFQQPSTAYNSFSVRSGASWSPPHPRWVFSWLDLVHASQSLGVCVCDGPATALRQSSTAFASYRVSVPSPVKLPEPRGQWVQCPFSDIRAVRSLFSSLPGCGSLCSPPSTASRSFSAEGWEMHSSVKIHI